MCHARSLFKTLKLSLSASGSADVTITATATVADSPVTLSQTIISYIILSCIRGFRMLDAHHLRSTAFPHTQTHITQ